MGCTAIEQITARQEAGRQDYFAPVPWQDALLVRARLDAFTPI